MTEQSDSRMAVFIAAGAYIHRSIASYWCFLDFLDLSLPSFMSEKESNLGPRGQGKVFSTWPGNEERLFTRNLSEGLIQGVG